MIAIAAIGELHCGRETALYCERDGGCLQIAFVEALLGNLISKEVFRLGGVGKRQSIC